MSIKEVLVIDCGIERIECTETILRSTAEYISILLHTPEKVFCPFMLDSPTAKVPLGLMLKGQFLATLASYDIPACLIS